MSTNEGELKKEVRIEHKPSKDFASHTATGVLLSGPTSDEFYHLVFYADVVEINYEVSVLVSQGIEQATYETEIPPGSISMFRENRARVSMSEEAMRQLSRLLQARFPEK
jgi:hypothetical protein